MTDCWLRFCVLQKLIWICQLFKTAQCKHLLFLIASQVTFGQTPVIIGLTVRQTARTIYAGYFCFYCVINFRWQKRMWNWVLICRSETGQSIWVDIGSVLLWVTNGELLGKTSKFYIYSSIFITKKKKGKAYSVCASFTIPDKSFYSTNFLSISVCCYVFCLCYRDYGLPIGKFPSPRARQKIMTQPSLLHYCMKFN